jgi:hypothetical protein
MKFITWVTEVAISYAICSQRVFDAADESAALRMEVTGEYHYGQFINVYRRGMLSQQ